VRAAADAWHSKSFDGVGVAEICRLAKVNKGSFFHFFESKNALLIAVLDRHAEDLRAHLESGPFRPDIPPLARLERFLHEMGAMMKDERRRTGCPRGCPIGNIVSELATRDDAARDAARRALDVFRDAFAQVLREAAADGSLPAGIDVDLGADAILAYLQGLAVFGKAYRDQARLERLGALVPALFGGDRSAPGARAEARRRPRRAKAT
jgi:TetR/AcrR family transcriptional regulator, transcriptional repressor for nem operon